MQIMVRQRFADTLRHVRRLALLLIGLAFAGCAGPDAKWSSAAYREAVARDNDDEIGRQLRAAVRERALIARSLAIASERCWVSPCTYDVRSASTSSTPAGSTTRSRSAIRTFWKSSTTPLRGGLCAPSYSVSPA